MKQKILESPGTLIQWFIDEEEWAVARWGATCFLYDPAGISQDVPCIGLAFQNLNHGKTIFEGWLQRLGHIDKYEELRLSIIEGPIPSELPGYTVLISSNPINTIKRKQLEDPEFAPTHFARISKLNRMTPASGSQHLHFFKQHFARLGRYRICPAGYEGSQIRDIDFSRYIEKRELNLCHTLELHPQDLEYAAITPELKSY